VSNSNFPGGFAHGVTIRGVPLTVANPGKVYWVDSVTGSNGNKGTVDRPFSTIDYAVGRCTANKGDIIFVKPGHSETISAAGSLTLDVAGVAVIGLGTGTDRPDLNYSATAGTVEIDAANVTLYNLTFTADVSAITVGVNVDADSATIDNCEFNYNATGDDFVTMIDADTVNGFTLSNSRLIAESIAGCAEAIRLDTANETTIVGNYIFGDFTDGAIIGEGAASVDLVIANNKIYNADTTAGFVIDLNVACTGIMSGNSCGTLYATDPESTIDPGSLLSNENYVCNAVDESGALVPVTVST
jgi:hypothetical protein